MCRLALGLFLLRALLRRQLCLAIAFGLLSLLLQAAMPALSAASAMAPPSASTSFTRWLLPIPPMAGLQDMTPIPSRVSVTSAVRAPIRAAA